MSCRLALVLLLAAPGLAEAKVSQTFLGWSTDRSYYVVRSDHGLIVYGAGGKSHGVEHYHFVRTRPDVPATWPKGREDAWAELTAPKASAVGPGGETIQVVERDGERIYAVMAAGRTLFLRQRFGKYAVVRDTYWRADGRALALLVEYVGRGPDSGSTVVTVLELTPYFVPGGDRKAARRARRVARRAARRQDWETARDELQEAVNLDPTFVNAHYELAAAAARRGDLATTLRELDWLAISADRRLVKARSDRAFDRVSTHEDVRKLLGLGPSAAVPAGRWTREGVYCGDPWLTLTLRKGGKARLRRRSDCDDEGAWHEDDTYAGSWWIDRTGAHVLFPDHGQDDAPRAATLRFVACPDGTCLELAAASARFGPFHRGEPGGLMRF